MDGFEVTQYLRTFLQKLPVVLVSQAEAPFARYLRDTGGASAFVSKGQGAEAILSAAEHLLKNRMRLVHDRNPAA